jgi:methyl farnesoate epoxidase/farnesoate epoxidase
LKQRNGFFGLSAINVLWAVLGGVRHSHNDGDFKELLQKITRLFRTGNPSGDIIDVLPFLRFLFPNLAGYKERNAGTIGGQNFFRVSKR